MKTFEVVDASGHIICTSYDRKDAELFLAGQRNAPELDIVEGEEPDPKCCNNPSNLFLSQGGLTRK